jgi:chaperonin GroEL
MAAKRFLFGEGARRRLLDGARVVAGAVEPTLGPAGRTVLLQRPMFSAPLATKDGVTVAEEIELPDEFANMGAQLVMESAARTSLAAGDGTTTATVLAHAIYREGARLVAAGHHPADLKRGIDAATARVSEALGRISKPVAGRKDIARIASISANGDASVGDLIASAVDQVGQDGIIHVEQGTALETKLEVAEGVEVDRGYLSAYFVTDMERLVARLDDPYILLCQDKITRVAELVPILEQVKRAGRSLLVVGELQGDALSLLVVNKLQGALAVCALMPPYYTESRKAALGDLAAQTGGRVVVAEEPGITLATVRLSDLGSAKRVVVDQEKTTIVGGAGRKADVEARAREIRALYEATASTFKHQQLDERLRRLVGGAALVRVGGTTDAETRERKARIEDALFATRAAIQEGIVVGGGVALVRASEVLAKAKNGKNGRSGSPASEAAGVAIVRRACAIPCRRIADNAGADGSVVVARVREGRDGFGYNAATGRFEDLLAAGVVDPTMVVRLALQHAASIAVLLLTTEACIADAPREAVDFPTKGSSHDALSLEPYLSRRR